MKNIKNQENKKLASLFYKSKKFFDSIESKNFSLDSIESKNFSLDSIETDEKFFNSFDSKNLKNPAIFDVHAALSNISPSAQYKKKSLVEVNDKDVLDMAKIYISRGYNPVILNFASKILPGGGVKKGAVSQEEDIFRRTNLYQTLNRETCEYPLNKIVYTSNLYVAFDKKGNFLKEPYSLACISAAAVRWPVVSFADGKEDFFMLKDKEYVRESINTIFKIAMLNGHDSIILGAWGCGAYEGPRHAIANNFKECIDLYSFNFKIIGFPILIRNARDQENYNIFKTIIN